MLNLFIFSCNFFIHIYQEFSLMKNCWFCLKIRKNKKRFCPHWKNETLSLFWRTADCFTCFDFFYLFTSWLTLNVGVSQAARSRLQLAYNAPASQERTIFSVLPSIQGLPLKCNLFFLRFLYLFAFKTLHGLALTNLSCDNPMKMWEMNMKEMVILNKRLQPQWYFCFKLSTHNAAVLPPFPAAAWSYAQQSTST